MTGDVRRSIKSAIRDHGGSGAPVDDVLSTVASAHSESESVDVFERMKRAGDVYVVPDNPDRVKVTDR